MGQHNTLMYKMYRMMYPSCINDIALHGWTASVLSHSQLFNIGILFEWYIVMQGVAMVNIRIYVLKHSQQYTQFRKAMMKFYTEHII